jgi:cytidylate kinase
MAWHFAENSFKVYLYVPIEVSVKRILGDGTRGNVEEYADAADAEAKILARMQSESLRYKEFYGVDNHDLNNYDLILCTSHISPEEAADTIWREFNVYLKDPANYPKPNKLYME